jgi:hypothetical protein
MEYLRHGHRAPFKTLTKDTGKAAINLGDLTPLGRQQLFNLG